jgi:hypothetical protein
VVLGLVAVLAVAIGTAGAPRGSSTLPASTVVTAPTTTVAPAPPRDVGPRLRPVEGSCSAGRERILRVMQFNIHFGTSPSGSVDLASVASEIESVRPDLVSLNEVDSGTLRTRRIDMPRYLAASTGLHAVYGPNVPWEGGLFGNAILTRLPMVASSDAARRGSFPRLLVPAPQRRERRPDQPHPAGTSGRGRPEAGGAADDRGR